MKKLIPVTFPVPVPARVPELVPVTFLSLARVFVSPSTARDSACAGACPRLE
ncbi:hypothetical protein FRC0326_01083 [Corynebacterium diphtheriae]|nr:hypothetical protein FRC0132_01021 [Corynebacterium diphtheriae]CAB0842098.1 hypothetical protein FRC0326_01083 [Corynebacterium diphtheriae]